MKIIGIISEYNPLHLGHIYQISSIREKFPDSIIIGLMSGSFVQRGEPAIIDKFTRAKSAVNNGLDLVLEMPTAISLQSADYFGKYCVKILDRCGIIDYLSFGIEDSSEEDFMKKLKVYYTKKDLIDKSQYTYIRDGISYKKSFELALKDHIGEDLSSFTKANNILGLAYVRSLNDIKSSILPLPIVRQGAGYHNLEGGDFKFQSASFIRKNILKNKSVEKYLPRDLNFKKAKLHSLDDYNHIFYYLAFVLKKSPKNIAGYENGILNLLKKHFLGSIEEMLRKSHNARYSISRLQRFVINYILGIESRHIEALDSLSYIKPLYFNERGAMALKLIKEKESIEVIKRPREAGNLSPSDRLLYGLDLDSFKLYNLKNQEENQKEYTNNPFCQKLGSVESGGGSQ